MLCGNLSLPSRECVGRKMRGEKNKKEKKIGKKIVDCSVAADGQIVEEDEFSVFGDKCNLCQRRFEEQGKIIRISSTRA